MLRVGPSHTPKVQGIQVQYARPGTRLDVPGLPGFVLPSPPGRSVYHIRGNDPEYCHSLLGAMHLLDASQPRRSRGQVQLSSRVIPVKVGLGAGLAH